MEKKDKRNRSHNINQEKISELFTTFIPVIQKFGQMATDGQFSGTFNIPTNYQQCNSPSSCDSSDIEIEEDSINTDTIIPIELVDLNKYNEGKQFLKNSYSSETWIDNLGRRRVHTKKEYTSSNGISKYYEKKIIGNASHESEWEIRDGNKNVIKDNYKGVDCMEFHRIWKQGKGKEPTTPLNSPISND